jgi:hypothetical protein
MHRIECTGEKAWQAPLVARDSDDIANQFVDSSTWPKKKRSASNSLCEHEARS